MELTVESVVFLRVNGKYSGSVTYADESDKVSVKVPLSDDAFEEIVGVLGTFHLEQSDDDE